MKVETLFEKLSYGELYSMVLSEDGSGTLQREDWNRIISFTNNGLRDLYNKFVISEKELIVKSIDWKSKYPLTVEHAYTNPTPAIKYIEDRSDDPFTGDVLKILEVTNEVGAPLPLNDPEQWASVFTPQYNVLQLTHPGCGQIFSVIYQAAPEVLRADLECDQDILDQEFLIPLALEGALTAYIGSEVFSSMAGQESNMKSQELKEKYLEICSEVERKDLTSEYNTITNVKLYRRGFI